VGEVMSDFLSPAINNRLKEKDMDFNKRLDALMSNYHEADLRKDGDSDSMKEAIRLLLLDTIEKAKPPAKLPSEINDGGNTFNNGVSAFEQALVKEIKK
jgi:hypothetical protein